MKASELMIGDWVRAGNSFPMQVVGLYSDVAYLDFEGNEADMFEEKEVDLEPIPITKKILEKNGFEKERLCDNWYEVQYREDKTTFPFELYFDSGANEYVVFYEEYSIFGIKYVHELQHIMKLCKVKEEIVL